jgi:SAM-dependent methyltransferase
MMTRKLPEANVQQGFMLAAIIELCQDPPRASILSVGCFEDTAYESLLKMGLKVEGIDPEVNGQDLDAFVRANPDRKNSYDIVFSTSVLEHVEDDERFVFHVAELLAPGGFGIFTCDFKNNWRPDDPIPSVDFRYYRSADLGGRLLLAMPNCELLDSPDWEKYEPDFRLGDCFYNFATFTVQKNRT